MKVRRSKIQRLSEQKISRKMTVKELRSYIREGTEAINKYLHQKKHYDVLDKATIQIYNIAGANKRTGDIKKNLYVNKDELLERATRIRAFFALDVYTTQKKQYMNEKMQKAFQHFKETTGIDINEKTYTRMVRVMGDLGDDILEKLGSDQFANLFSTYAYSGSDATIIDIIKEEVEDADGVSQRTLLKRIRNRFKDELVDESDLEY